MSDVGGAGGDRRAPPISPIAWEAVKRIDASFDVEREINGLLADQRLGSRGALEARPSPLRSRNGCAPSAESSRGASRAKAHDTMRTRWPAFTRFLEDGCICLTNNAADRALRGRALGRKSWAFAGSERGADRAAVMCALIQPTEANDVDPQARLADVLARIADRPIADLAALPPWRWAEERECRKLAA